jgi:hypothetical protein
MAGTGLYAPLNSTVMVAINDERGNATAVKCLAANIPSGVAGYATGCELFTTDTGAQYSNTGSATSCTFTLQSSVPASSVTLAMLTAGITPSHVVKYAGTITWSGSGASLATTVMGVAATDIVIASIQTAPTQAAYLVSATGTLNTITLVLSAANTSNNAVISYQVLRAAA